MKYAALFLLCVFLVGCNALPNPQSTFISPVTRSPRPVPAPNPIPTPPVTPPPPPPPPPPGVQCASDEFDMLDWMTMDEDLRSQYYLDGIKADGSHANPIYTVVESDKFYWVKGDGGSPWDIELYDDNGIYDWITEWQWSDPYTYKKSLDNTNKKWANRCMKSGDTVKSSNTQYEIVTACTNKVIKDLKKMITSVQGPTQVTLGGNLPDNLDVLVFNYDYVCDDNYANCKDREQYLFNQRYGLVHWQHQNLQSDGSYGVPDNLTNFNQLKTGSPPIPNFPCF